MDADLKKLMRSLKLGRMLDTLPERLALAKQQSMPYADFLSLVFADEVERRDRTSADLRARAAKLDPAMRLERFSSDSPVRYDKELWNELCSLRFLDDARGALILGPVGVGKTHLATALGPYRGPPAPDRPSSCVPTRCSAYSRPPGSITASKPRCAPSPASRC